MYDEFCSVQNLKNAYLHVKNDLERSSLEVSPLLSHSIKIIDSLGEKFFGALSKLLQSFKESPTQYRVTQADYIYIPKQGFGYRPICNLGIVDRIVYQALFEKDILGAKIDGQLTQCCYANRINTDTNEYFFQYYMPKYKAFIASIKKSLKSGLKWKVTLDVDSYYENINHEILIRQLKEEFGIKDKAILEFLENFLASNCEVKNTGRGIPQSAEVSAVISNAYLNELDCKLRQYSEYKKEFDYFRYNDDIVLTAKTKEIAVKLAKEISTFLRKRGLKPNSKSKIEIKEGDEIKEVDYYIPSNEEPAETNKRKKVEEIEPNLLALIRKIKQGGLQNITRKDKWLFGTYLSTGEKYKSFDFTFPITNILLDLEPIVPKVFRFLFANIETLDKKHLEMLKLEKRKSHITYRVNTHYKLLWDFYCNKPVDSYTKLWIIKFLSLTCFIETNKEEFESTLKAIWKNPLNGYLRPLYLYHAYKQHPSDLTKYFDVDDLQECIKNSSSEIEKSIYYFFSGMVMEEQPHKTLSLVNDSLNHDSYEIQLVGIYLQSQFNVKTDNAHLGTMSKTYFCIEGKSKKIKEITGQSITINNTTNFNFNVPMSELYGFSRKAKDKTKKKVRTKRKKEIQPIEDVPNTEDLIAQYGHFSLSKDDNIYCKSKPVNFKGQGISRDILTYIIKNDSRSISCRLLEDILPNSTIKHESKVAYINKLEKFVKKQLNTRNKQKLFIVSNRGTKLKDNTIWEINRPLFGHKN